MLQHSFSLVSDGDIFSQEDTEEDPLLELDEHIFQMQNTLGDNYDLISGHVGIGHYWLERFPRYAAIRGIESTLDNLERLSEQRSDGITWFTPPAVIPSIQLNRAPFGYYNLGVAHGVPGVIGFLGQLVKLNINKSVTFRANELLSGAIRWLVSQQGVSTVTSSYGHWIPKNGSDGRETRICWCYGDLGIAAVLHTVAQGIGDQQLLLDADILLEKCVMRESCVGIDYYDSALCHGAFGIAHIYNRIYQASKKDLYRTASLEWLRRGLALRKPNIGIAGYYSWRFDTSPQEYPDPTFLSGALGIALALLAAITPIEPKWDRIMQLSMV
jgi:lantibiotic modifying enzyme